MYILFKYLKNDMYNTGTIIMLAEYKYAANNGSRFLFLWIHKSWLKVDQLFDFFAIFAACKF